MKRLFPSVQTSDRAYAQQPVSCQLCRSRKLKCDRGRPSCFNCKSRNRECTYEADQRQAPALVANGTLLTNPDDYRFNATYDNADLVRRVERLERAVFAARQPETGQDRPLDFSRRPSRCPRSPPANNDEEQQKTSQWLEGLLTATSAVGGSAASPAQAELSQIIRGFPTQDDASKLLKCYIETVDATYRILHSPTTWNLLEELYADLGEDRVPSATRLGFFLCIFAGSAYISRKSFHFESHHLQGVSKVALAEVWAQQAVSLVTKPPARPSIEALQTIMSLAHLCTQIEGISGNFGVLTMSGLHMAKAMKLHRLDSQPLREERQKNGADLVDVEIKRRIWWHMVASDWLLSFVGGHNEGTYMLHPRQMETFHPSNVEDVLIPTGVVYLSEASYNLPLTSPTSISYFLYRIQAATLVREVIDSLPPSFFTSPGSDTSDEVYDNIIALDLKYQQFIKSLPPYFQLTIEDPEYHQALIDEKPYLEWQRFLINFILNTHLARLHRPFLIRGSRQSKYEHSRLQCIRSAEIVIKLQNRVIGDQAMDVCYNPSTHNASRRKQDVLQACRALEEELNAKLVPSNAEASNEVSSGQLMVQSFRNAVQTLRSTLRKKTREDGSDDSTAPEIADRSASTEKRRRIAAQESAAAIGIGGSDAPLSVHDAVESGASQGPKQGLEGQDQQGFNAAAPSNEAAEVDAPGELMVDELWDEVFTFGATFNDTDWDAFFSDIGANMH